MYEVLFTNNLKQDDLSLFLGQAMYPRRLTLNITLAPKPNADRINIVHFLLTSLNHITRWPLHISCVGTQVPEIIFDTFGKHHGHVIFTWAEEREVDAIGHLIDQLEEMKNSPLWNS